MSLLSIRFAAIGFENTKLLYNCFLHKGRAESCNNKKWQILNELVEQDYRYYSVPSVRFY